MGGGWEFPGPSYRVRKNFEGSEVNPNFPHLDPRNFPNLPPYTLALKYFTITSPKYGACNLMTPISYGL